MHTSFDLYNWFSAWLLALPRVLGMFAILPFTKTSLLPGMARNALLISLTIILMPVMLEQLNTMPKGLEGITFLILKEVFLGLVLGLIFSLPFFAMESAGSLIDRQRGVMAGQVSTPITAAKTTILGNFLSFYSVVLLFVSGGIYFLFEVFLSSYKVWPVTTYYPQLNIGMSGYFLQIFDSLMLMILIISGPILIVIFLVDLGFGFLNRSVPQINVFILSLPVKGLTSILILSLFMTKIAQYLRTIFSEYDSSFHLLENLFS
jgi:type III secretion protein T